MRSTFSEDATSIDSGVIGDDSGQMVDRFAQDLVDRHPEMSLSAGTRTGLDGSWRVCAMSLHCFTDLIQT